MNPLTRVLNSLRAVALSAAVAASLGSAAAPMAHAADAAEPPAVSAPHADDIRPVDDAWRAALPRDPQAATEAYLARLSPAARARSDAYFEGGYWLEVLQLVWGLAVAAVLLFSRLSRRMRAVGQRVSRRPFLQATVYAALYVAVVALFSLPLQIYSGFVREHAYGMATQSFPAWFGEQLMQFGLTLLIVAPLLALLLAVVKRFERTWWVWGALGFSGVMAVMVAAGPVFIDPLFNTYKPLEASPLQQRILALAHANGVPVDNVMWFDASRQTTRVSANVSGLFGTAVVRLNDNLLKRSSEPEILGVMGHEIGHYAMNHIPKMTLQFGLLIALFFAFTAWLSQRVLVRYGGRWGVSSLHDPGALPLLMAVLGIAGFLAMPLSNTIIRNQETEADLFGLNTARQPDGMAEVLLKLVEYRKARPGPIEEFVFFDHPSTYNRIFAAMRWKAAMMPAPAAASAPGGAVVIPADQSTLRMAGRMRGSNLARDTAK